MALVTRASAKAIEASRDAASSHTFLDLPLEIRQMIYLMVAESTTVRVHSTRRDDIIIPEGPIALLCSCKAINTEFTTYFFEKATFEIECFMLVRNYIAGPSPAPRIPLTNPLKQIVSARVWHPVTDLWIWGETQPNFSRLPCLRHLIFVLEPCLMLMARGPVVTHAGSSSIPPWTWFSSTLAYAKELQEVWKADKGRGLGTSFRKRVKTIDVRAREGPQVVPGESDGCTFVSCCLRFPEALCTDVVD